MPIEGFFRLKNSAAVSRQRIFHANKSHFISASSGSRRSRSRLSGDLPYDQGLWPVAALSKYTVCGEKIIKHHSFAFGYVFRLIQTVSAFKSDETKTQYPHPF